MMCKDVVQEAPEAHSMPAAVSLMIKGLLYAGHFTLHDDKAFDQAYFAHLTVLFRVCTSCPGIPRQSCWQLEAGFSSCLHPVTRSDSQH